MFWQNFVILCNKNNTKPNPVAKKLGLSSGSVTKWKNGAEPNATTIQRIADYFDVTVDYLLSDEKEKPRADTNPTELIFPSGEKLSEDESIMITTYRHLNNEGKKKAAEYISDLAGNSNYVSEGEIFYIRTAASSGSVDADESYKFRKKPYTAAELEDIKKLKDVDDLE